ncbi:hypothetical protein C8F01DRAFT_1267529 [Mycena amicta]|nr:hypothetical protein C8F01DRAFT_1267529 [Mycena amicta]
MAQAYRLVYLDIGGAREYLMDFMEKMSSRSFPLLDRLCLEVKRKNDDSSHDEDPLIIAPLPQQVLDGRIPRLRGLELVAVEPQWASLHSLHYLTLESKHAPLSNPLQFHVFLSILRACPDLVVLHVDLLLERGTHELYSSVRLPRLERLLIRDRCRTIQDIFQLVSFPVTVRLHLDVYNNRVDNDNLLVPIRKQLRSPGALVPGNIIIYAPKREENEMIGWLSVHIDVPRDQVLSWEHRAPPILFINVYPRTATAREQKLVKILHAIPTSNITHLILTKATSIELNVDDAGLKLCEGLTQLGSVLPLRILEVTARIREEDMAIVAPFLASLKTVLRQYLTIGKQLQRATFRWWPYLRTKNAERKLVVDWEDIRGLVDELVVKF